MQALVLESTRHLNLREIEIAEPPGPHDVRIRIHTVGVCGSDVHYYRHGAIGPFVVRAPMVLGHEAAGVVEEAGPAVTTLRVGDRVCMEPGIPDPNSRATRLGLYNLDPAVRRADDERVHATEPPYRYSKHRSRRRHPARKLLPSRAPVIATAANRRQRAKTKPKPKAVAAAPRAAPAAGAGNAGAGGARRQVTGLDPGARQSVAENPRSTYTINRDTIEKLP